MTAVPSFQTLGVSDAVASILARRGIEAPFPIQALVMRDALEGRDVLAKSRTGSGKTLAFSIPIVERVSPTEGASALVLVPTRELCVQVTDELRDIAKAKGLTVAPVYGGAKIGPQADRARKADVLIATPGRLEDLATRGSVKLGGIRILVLDEADRMLDMGFQPQVDRIVRRLPKQRQTMFFSATLDGAAGRLAAAYTDGPARHEVATDGKTIEEVEHRFVAVDQSDKVDALINLLPRGDAEGLALVFVRTKRGADRLVKRLRAKGIKAEAMHGDLAQSARERALARFESGRSTVLVATDVAARGLDVEHIEHVINFDPPEDHRGYVHRVGRTGRAGRGGNGITLVTRDQQGDVGRMAAALDLHDEFGESGMAVPPPRVVFSGSPGGRRSSLRPRRRG
ncbi:MAG TPA: DEAD/DEAH box helicase [Actinomycetota bacterium]|nr:DEAD/DEAH box helicase [Actinomycetota bacterium]